ncbi:hypothetical protein [Microseira wollei]|uniref:WD-40 repeat-containing protein n=1 Tax=Microseira wollei NIES-4236 TaxID=2530354 RepID=A0AAV3X4C5_9CYAN|nr:hypothetical protein [Microseira wollei]GET35445.1 WD-40 repeat-containing protein [Microseira wollei NIES-4236]
MNSEEALKFINSLFEQQTKEILNELETKIFLGCWSGQDYSEISAKNSHSEVYIREIGAKLKF